MKLWNATPEGRAVQALGSAIGGDVLARRAGYPMRRVLAELKKGQRSADSLMAALGFTRAQVQGACHNLRDKGHYIIGERGGLYRLVTLEEAADDWASGRAVTNAERVLGALMECPRTVAELAALGVSRDLVPLSVYILRDNGHNIVIRGPRGPRGGAYHLIQDARHPWLHLHMMDLRGAAWNDPTFSLQDRK
ncbi:MAG: hypothetical protein IH859_02670 [Chloroflexi bacterium]|nr:hypothetical protein [Chloroflexota bacterium]